jgi:hypothetical protein
MSSSMQVFWGEIAPCEHVLQIYENDATFMESLEGFVRAGFEAGESVVAIATKEHLRTLERRLDAAGLDVRGLKAADRYLALDAEEFLTRFMVNGWPDEAKFKEEIRAVLARARRGNSRVRAFGEMVAVLWAQGHHGATVNLEHLWHRICEEDGLPLYCAYPRIGMTDDLSSSVEAVREAHTRIVPDRLFARGA